MIHSRSIQRYVYSASNYHSKCIENAQSPNLYIYFLSSPSLQEPAPRPTSTVVWQSVSGLPTAKKDEVPETKAAKIWGSWNRISLNMRHLKPELPLKIWGSWNRISLKMRHLKPELPLKIWGSWNQSPHKRGTWNQSHQKNEVPETRATKKMRYLKSEMLKN